ncbi:MAG: HEAT repeat domain-containing protein, partial [Promethearchaeota archaeon]
LKEASLRAIANIRFDEPEIKLFIEELDNGTQSIREFIKNQLIMLNPEDSIKILLTSLTNKTFSQEHKAEIINLIGLELASINITFENSSYLKIKYPELFAYLLQYKNILLENITTISIQENSELLKNALAIFKTLGDELNKDLIKLLLKDDFIIKKNAIKLVGKLKLKDAVDFLIVNLDNIYSEVSIASIEALGEIGDLSAVPELLNVLNIEDISYEYLDLDMKFYILDSVKRIYLNNKDASYNELFSYLEGENDTIKESIAFIFGEIAKDEFVKPLVNLLDIKNVDVKKNSVIAMGKIGNIDALEPLIKILEDKYSYWIIKKVAVDAIYHIFQKNSYLLTEKREESRRRLTMSTAKLIDYLGRKEKENFKVKLSLIRFLEEYGGEPALNALLKRVNDFHRVVRIYASNAIKKIEEKLELENSQQN